MEIAIAFGLMFLLIAIAVYYSYAPAKKSKDPVLSYYSQEDNQFVIHDAADNSYYTVPNYFDVNELDTLRDQMALDAFVGPAKSVRLMKEAIRCKKAGWIVLPTNPNGEYWDAQAEDNLRKDSLVENQIDIVASACCREKVTTMNNGAFRCVKCNRFTKRIIR